jgi:hypothetical protein
MNPTPENFVRFLIDLFLISPSESRARVNAMNWVRETSGVLRAGVLIAIVSLVTVGVATFQATIANADTGGLVWPADGLVSQTVQGHLDLEKTRAVDIANWSPYTPIVAAAAGTAVIASTGENRDCHLKNAASNGLGNYVVLLHSDARGVTYTTYAHFLSTRVKQGDTVAQGQQLGVMGSTGCSSGPHLHFAVSTCVRIFSCSVWASPGPALNDKITRGVPIENSSYPGVSAKSANTPANPGAAWQPGLLDLMLQVPVGDIGRDSSSGHSFLVTSEGWASIPTGGDYQCFVSNGAHVVNIFGLDSMMKGFKAKDVKCNPRQTSTDSLQPVPEVPLPLAPLPNPPQPIPQIRPVDAQPHSTPTLAPSQPATAQPQTASAPTPTPSQAPVPAPSTSPAGPPPTPGPYPEQEGHHGSDTFQNYHNASGMGPRVDPAQWVQVSCKVYDPTISSVNPGGFWYKLASSPWSDAYYAPANTFMNGDPWGGPYSHNTDMAVPDC